MHWRFAGVSPIINHKFLGLKKGQKEEEERKRAEIEGLKKKCARKKIITEYALAFCRFLANYSNHSKPTPPSLDSLTTLGHSTLV